ESAPGSTPSPQLEVPLLAYALTDLLLPKITWRSWNISGRTWHSNSTVAMGPREQGGCADTRLNIYGTTGLKVA
ncbi:hypothetical protein FRC08_017814, partial [Ceratobasidium sp. 394]